MGLYDTWYYVQQERKVKNEKAGFMWIFQKPISKFTKLTYPSPKDVNVECATQSIVAWLFFKKPQNTATNF